jgi:pilus assembly protein CpaB
MLIILLSAFAIASMSAFLVWRMVGARISASKPIATTKVVAASKDIKLGTVLDASDLTTIQLVGSAPTGAILDVKNAIGRGAMSQIYSGEPILESRLAPKGSGGGLAATIQQGMRACAVKVDEVVGVAGFVTPGMRVDVLVSGVPPNAQGANNSEVRTILQNIEVLSAGTDIQKDSEGKPQQVQVVNLLVTPDQAQILALASSQMRIQLVLRNPLDTKVSTVQETAMSSLFGQPKPAAPTGPVKRVRVAPPTYTVQVINGNKSTEQKFAAAGGQQ